MTIRIKNLFTFFTIFLLPLTFFLVVLNANYFLNYDSLIKNRPSFPLDVNSSCNVNNFDDELCQHKLALPIGKVLLIGDSHASQLSQSVLDASLSNSVDLTILTGSSCSIANVMAKDRTESKRDYCLNYFNNSLAFVSELKPQLIIISVYFNKSMPINELRSGILDLKKLDTKILIVENIPIFPDKEFYMVPRPIALNPYYPPKYFNVNEMDTSDELVSGSMSAWANSVGIETVNFRDLFCDQSICSRYNKNTWLYFNYNHLSTWGAKLTVPFFQNYIKNKFS